MEEVEGGVEDLVAGAHAEEDGAGGVVDVHDRVLAGVEKLVRGTALFSKKMGSLKGIQILK